MYTAIDIIQGMKRNWTAERFYQGSFARNANGFTTDWQRWNQGDGGQAVAFCAAGAANVEADKLGPIERGPCGTPTYPSILNDALGMIAAEIAERTYNPATGGHLGIAGYNDSHSHADMVDVLDAILKRHAKNMGIKAEARRQDVMALDLVLAGV